LKFQEATAHGQKPKRVIIDYMAGKMGLPRNGLKRELEPELFELVVLGKQVAVTIALCYRRADVGSSVPLGA